MVWRSRSHYCLLRKGFWHGRRGPFTNEHVQLGKVSYDTNKQNLEQLPSVIFILGRVVNDAHDEIDHACL